MITRGCLALVSMLVLGCSGSGASQQGPRPEAGPLDSGVDFPDATQDSGVDEHPLEDGRVDAHIPADSATDAHPDSSDGAVALRTKICPESYLDPTATEITNPSELTEVSGMIASVRNHEVLWLHNDSGDSARLFAVSTSGTVLGQVHVTQEDAKDWEDIAIAPCPDASGPCLWIADTGDNLLERSDVEVLAIPEPSVGQQPFETVSLKAPWSFHFKYPEGPVDSEAMVLNPEGSTAYFFEKVDAAQARVFQYQAPFLQDSVYSAQPHTTINSPGVPVEKGRMITAGDLHPSGTRLLLRVYTGVFEYRFPDGPVMDVLEEIKPFMAVIGPASEPQGEAIAYDSSSAGFWTMSESTDGTPQALHHYACRQTPIDP